MPPFHSLLLFLGVESGQCKGLWGGSPPAGQLAEEDEEDLLMMLPGKLINHLWNHPAPQNLQLVRKYTFLVI